MTKTNILNALALLIILPLFLAQNAAAGERYGIRTCTVQEVLDSGGYSFIRCREGSRETWLGVLLTRLDIGEQISYQDCPPLPNFRSNSLDRLFPEIRFVPGVSRAGEPPVAPTEVETIAPEMAPSFNQTDLPVAPEPAPSWNPTGVYVAPTSARSRSQTDVYAGTDESGTLVFTDDPAKAPGGARRK
ncbi:hypothetical protein [Geotalea toluenoxydans]|uniref:hypothetical protein n=1 Tax=Geotalea toluenoxydans TaxID=421624 RepID=UPI0006D2BC84|nr:hypothetical protein [Geotalea toluenoxydans]